MALAGVTLRDGREPCQSLQGADLKGLVDPVGCVMDRTLRHIRCSAEFHGLH